MSATGTIDQALRQITAAVVQEAVRAALSSPQLTPDWPPGVLAVREDEAEKVIAVKKTTLRDLRLKGLLPSRRVGNSHFYLREDLLTLLGHDAS